MHFKTRSVSLKNRVRTISFSLPLSFSLLSLFYHSLFRFFYVSTSLCYLARSKIEVKIPLTVSNKVLITICAPVIIIRVAPAVDFCSQVYVWPGRTFAICIASGIKRRNAASAANRTRKGNVRGRIARDDDIDDNRRCRSECEILGVSRQTSPSHAISYRTVATHRLINLGDR